MAYSTIMGFIIALSVMGLCFFSIVVPYLKKRDTGTSVNKRLLGFAEKEQARQNPELIQCLKQIEVSFGQIADAIHRERRIFIELIKKNEQELKRQVHITDRLESASDCRLKENLDIQKQDRHRTTQYKDVMKLAASGLDAKEISNRLKIPKGEIELILKFRALRQKAFSKSQMGIPSDPAKN